MKGKYQIELQDYVKSISKVKDLLRKLEIECIRLDDIKILNEFNKIFGEEEFRESVRVYRVNYGNQKLKEELELIEKAINTYLDFYRKNEDNLKAIDNYQLMHDHLKAYKKFEKQEHEDLVKINCKVTEFKNKHENATWNLPENSQKVRNISYDLAYYKKLHEEKKGRKKYWTNRYNEEFDDNEELLSFRFSSLFEKFSILKDIIIEDYADHEETFNRKFNNELVELINEIFEPELNSDDALKFFNDIGSIDINIRNRKTTKYYCLVYLFSEKIENKTLRNRWENSILSYFGKERSTYLKKRKGEEDFWNRLKSTLMDY